MLSIGMPRVLGEMIGGIMMGPTCLGLFYPELMAGLFTAETKSVLSVIGTIGVGLYMFLIGMELNVKRSSSLLEVGKVTAAGFLVPFAFGLLAALYLHDTLAAGIPIGQFAFFMAIAVSITSIPMLARILEEKNLHSSPLGQLTILAASLDDLGAWFLLTILIAATQSTGTIGNRFGQILMAIGMIVMLYVVVKPLLRRFVRTAQGTDTMNEGMLGIVLLAILSVAWLSELIGITSVIGCFLLGTIMPDAAPVQRMIDERLKGLVTSLFIPVYFVHAGLKADLRSLLQVELLIPFGILLGVSFFGKYLGCSLTMRKMGYSWRDSSALGGLMNAKGLMGLVIAELGLELGYVSQPVYSLLVLTAIATTALSIVVYKLSTRLPHPGIRGAASVMPPGELAKQ
ncbi:Kef-type K+ transport system membrane component KefB [Paenibacillus phyllosphaerae]|uniref:Kef-type K+ transport system membrane component KefB n=2 Tax=Paenibacillus phyllosphaerae TaxID=274593 RepID=A0A7W5FRI1_9BACL|nr:Kef-type K+ transport system membrane component KefB [Paenibacillus phyllosphaerae]